MKTVYNLDEKHVFQLHALYQNEWWTKGRSLEATRNCVSGSQICIGLLDENDDLAGFVRVLTDYIFKAFIFDVIVSPDLRGNGLGNRLVSLVTSHEKLKSVRHFELYCLPELFPYYEKHGFTPDIGAIRLMRLVNAK